MRLEYRFFGRRAGNFRPSHFDSDQDLEQALKGHLADSVSQLFSPRCVNRADVACEEDESRNGWLTRSRQNADGAFVRGVGRGVVIFSADCPLLALRSGDRLGVFHCGIGSLLEKPSIIQQLPKLFELDKVDEAYFGWGAGPCCYGLHRPPPGLAQYQLRLVDNGPRAGTYGINLFRMVRDQLSELPGPKLREGVLLFKGECTACAGRRGLSGFSGEPEYYSNLWDCDRPPQERGRNAAVFWIVEHKGGRAS